MAASMERSGLRFLRQGSNTGSNSVLSNKKKRNCFFSTQFSPPFHEIAKWEKITYVGIVTCTILSIYNLSKGHPHHEDPPAYPYLHIRDKEFPWVHGVEHAFGAHESHDYPTSGVFEVEPRQCPGFRFRKSIYMGTTCLDPMQVRDFMELNSVNYNGDTYHLIGKNCNHSCKDIRFKLTGNLIPKWVNRLARIG